MNIIVPMAGMGKRLRPHTLTTPKPLLPIAGKPIVQRLCEDLASSAGEKINEIGFVVSKSFGETVEKNLLQIAESLGAKGSIHYQEEPLGTAHAILCAKPLLNGNCIVAFADTLFIADFSIDKSGDGVIWVHREEHPEQFGVVKISSENFITDFVEKPKEFVSDLAIIGIYYFNDGENLKKELQYLVDKNIKEKGEYQLTNALENMKQKGLKFRPAKVTEWLDCGNYKSTVFTNGRVLENIKNEMKILNKTNIVESVIVEPCYIGDNVVIKNSVIGPYVSVGANSKISNSIISDCIVQNNVTIEKANLQHSLIGNHAEYSGKPMELSLGDFSTGS